LEKLRDKYLELENGRSIAALKRKKVNGALALTILVMCMYRVGQKSATSLLFISSTVIDQFSKLFHWHILQTICNNVIITYFTTP